MNDFFHIDPRLEELAQRVEEEVSPAFKVLEATAEHNQLKVISAFQQNQVSGSFFYGSTGYGYGDRGRDALDAVYARIFGTEDALVRHNFVSGTHTLAASLFGMLRPGDTLLSLTGGPYDTMEEVIGLRGEGQGSLMEFGVKYQQVELLPDGMPDLAEIERAAAQPGVKVAYIQRSRGYSLRPSYPVELIGRMAAAAKKANPNVIVMVDNCYGEFSERLEPTQAGADICAGSLIKNPGGGIAQTGGYIAGRKDLVALCANRLTAPGIGKEEGCSLNQSRGMYLGLFFAPTVVCSAIKTAVFAARLFEELGFECYPRWDEPRTDLIQAVKLGTPEGMSAFCGGIQKGSAVDSFVVPEAWDMPGYGDKVIMAAGTFTEGASVELSADGPIREPYAVWMQGGLTYPSGKIGVLLAAQSMLEKGLIKNPTATQR